MQVRILNIVFIFDYLVVQVHLLCKAYWVTNCILCQLVTYCTCLFCGVDTVLCKDINLIRVCLSWRLYGIFTQTSSVKCIVLDEVWFYPGKQILFYYTNFCYFSKDLHELLNQVGAGLLPARPQFLKIVFVQTSVCVSVVCVCVCVRPKDINNQWHNVA